MAAASPSSSVNSFYSSGGVLRMNGTEFASGLDTQKLIDALTAKISSKIDTQKQMEQKTEWKRDMFREVEDLLQKFSDNYFSYSTNSSTNIMSRSFFDTQALVSSNSDIITATGASQDAGNVTVNSITQLAKAAEFSSVNSYQVSKEKIESAGPLGTMISPTSYITLQYNNSNYKIALGSGIDTSSVSGVNYNQPNPADTSNDVINANVAKAISKKFQDQINKSSDLKDHHITIQDDGHGKVTVTGAKIVDTSTSKNFADLGLTSTDTSSSFTVDNAKLSSTKTQLDGVSVEFRLDGVTKNIVFQDSESDRYSTPEGIRSYLQEKLDGAFGSGKITVGGPSTPTDNSNLSFSVTDPTKTSVLQIASASDYGVLRTDGVLRIASGDTNRTVLSKTLGDLKSSLNSTLQSSSTLAATEKDGTPHSNVYQFTINGQTFEYKDDTELNTVLNDINNNSAANVTISYSQTLDQFRMVSKSTGAQEHIDVKDSAGTLMASLFGGTTVVASGDVAQANYTDTTKTSTYSFQLGDVTVPNIHITGADYSHADPTNIGTFATSVQNALNDTNTAFGPGKIHVGITADGKGLTFQSVDGTSKLTVAAADGANDMLGIGTVGKSTVDFKQGVDLKMKATLGGTAKDITRSTNSFTLDGITMNVKKETSTAVSFSPSGNVDDLYKKISTFVDDYNKIIDKVNTYATQAPYGLGGSNGQTKKYDPLTDTQKKTMTDTQITQWNDKAKQGLLFNSTELTTLQSSIRSAMENTVSSVGMSLTDIGISTKAYDWTSGGKLVINDTQLKNALTSDPDKVAQLFTNTADGISQRVKSVINNNIGAYSNSGILFNMAGSSTMIGVDNSLLSKEMSDYDTSIKGLQTQLQDEQDRLQRKFTNMETVVYQLANQSNYLASMSSSGS